MKNKTVDKLALARGIREAGCQIPIAEDDDEPCDLPSNTLIAYQFGVNIENTVFEYPAGTGVIIKLVITSNAPKFAISQFDLELP